MQRTTSIHGRWSHRWVFILAAMGSSVGLGNIWKFPYITGENGGGTFVLIYLLCVFLIGLPLMMAEVLIGRRGRLSPVNAIALCARETSVSPRWQLLGGLGMLTGFLIFSFYSVVAAWILHYIPAMAKGVLAGAGIQQTSRYFEALLVSPERLILGHSAFVWVVMTVLALGVRRGLDRAVRIMMPALFFLLLLLLIYAANTGYFKHALVYLFHFDLAKVTPQSVLVAMGHAFFTLSLGMGAIMMYSAYMGRRDSIGRSVLWIGLLDTLIALMIGLAIFPIVFASQLDPASGPGLVFITLPVAFAQMPAGQVLGFVFFILVGLTALTSAISLMEPVTAWTVERFKVMRWQAALIWGVLAWLLGLAVLVSFETMSSLRFFSRNLFDWLNYFTSNLFLPLGGLGLAIFVGWKLSRRVTESELHLQQTWLYLAWYFAIRYLVPAALGIIFVANLYNII